MPLYVVHALDKPGGLTARMELADEHRAFLASEQHERLNVVIAGPLQSPDGETMTGSFFIIDADDQESAEGFVKACPFYGAVWDEVSINRFHCRVNRQQAA